MDEPDDPRFLTTDQAAKLLTLSKRTLERLRVDGTGPAYYKLGRGKRTRVVYRLVDLIKWIAQHTSTSEYDDAGQTPDNDREVQKQSVPESDTADDEGAEAVLESWPTNG